VTKKIIKKKKKDINLIKYILNKIKKNIILIIVLED